MISIIRVFHTDRFTVRVIAEEDFDTDLSWDETGEVQRKLETGELLAFGVKASVEFRGVEIATDYLGGCIYESPRAFMDHRQCAAEQRRVRADYAERGERSDNVHVGSYFSDMVRNVCQEARNTVADFQRLHLRAA